MLILFGSQAENRAHLDSDIDIAVVSRDYGKSRFKEGSELNLIASKLNSKFEAIPISLEEYLNPDSASPILHQIKKNGIVLF